jgi:uncharacterized protein (DUF2141 family)
MIHANRAVSPHARAARSLLAALSLCLAAAAAVAGDLTIEVSGITPDRGKVYIAVYDRPDTFPSGRQLVGQVLIPQDRHLTVHFSNLPPGRYAAAAFQDFNGNGKLDKNFLGIPKEPYGFSQEARGSIGPPTFAEAAITLDPDGATRVVLK